MRGLRYILFFISASTFAALTPEEITNIQTDLREPIQIQLTNGQEFFGFAELVSEKQIQLNIAKEAGEATFTFERTEVERIQVPGEHYKSLALEWIENGKDEEALILMDLLFAQRSTLIPALPESESNFFLIYAKLILNSPKPARAIAVVERLKPQIRNPAAIRSWEDTLLESHYTFELHETATELAIDWVEKRTPYGESALGYYVLGVSKLKEGAYEEALDLALQPIAFSSPLQTEKLPECYALAISAALKLRDPKYATTLYAEMQDRAMEWPTKDTTFEPFYKQLNEQLKKDAPKPN